MVTPNIHCCLLSSQLLPNLLPLLDPATKPGRVELLVSPDMKREFDIFTRMCRSLGVGVRRHDVAPYDYNAIAETMLDILAECENESLALNVTGGTKIMALGAYEAARQGEVEIFYIDTQNDSRITLAPEFKSEPLRELLTVKHCLNAFGYTIDRQADTCVKRAQRDLTVKLVKNVSRFAEPLKSLNYYTYEAKLNDLRVNVPVYKLKNGKFRELIQLFEQAGFLILHPDQSLLEYPGEEERFFVNGGWLELHVQAVCNKLRNDGVIKDLAGNVEVKSGSDVHNEIDVAFTARNRLFLVECKTRNFQNQADAAAYSIHKLNGLRKELSGVYGKALFVSCMELGEGNNTRCKDYKIELIQAGEINNLEARIKTWIEKA